MSNVTHMSPGIDSDLWTSLSLLFLCYTSGIIFQLFPGQLCWHRFMHQSEYSLSLLPLLPSSTRRSTVNSSLTRLQSSTTSLLPLAFSLELSCFIYECLCATKCSIYCRGKQVLTIYLNENYTQKDCQSCACFGCVYTCLIPHYLSKWIIPFQYRKEDHATMKNNL